MLPLHWNVVFMENRFDRTLWNASLAVDALIGMNIHHFGIFIEAFARANEQARLVFATIARLS